MDKTIGGGTGDTFIRDKKMETIGETKTSAQLPFPISGVASKKGYICIIRLEILWSKHDGEKNMSKMSEFKAEKQAKIRN